jgi:lipopolysaccharide export system protein LptA
MSSRSPSRRSRYLTALLLLLTLPAGLVQALPDDRDQPIHISADKALRDEKQGFTVYSGNVQMAQGSMRLEADKLTIYHVTDEVDKVVAEGRPAKMQQQPELDKAVVYAHAGVIEFFRSEDRVHLQTNARIEQDGAVVSGDSIDYFIAEQLVKADSDLAVEGNRVNVVIPPSGQSGAAKPGQNTKTKVNTPSGKPLPPAGTVPDGTLQEEGTPPKESIEKEDASGATESE